MKSKLGAALAATAIVTIITVGTTPSPVRADTTYDVNFTLLGGTTTTVTGTIVTDGATGTLVPTDFISWSFDTKFGDFSGTSANVTTNADFLTIFPP